MCHRQCVILLPLLLLSVCITACRDAGQSSAPPSSQAATPQKHIQPARIVSTVPAATLNLVLIGAADRLVGVSTYDRPYLPPDQKNLPVVGDYENLDYEELTTLKPTALIIQMAESRIPPQLKAIAEKQHIELVHMQLDKVADIWTSVALLGRIAGREAEASAAIATAQAELKAVAARYKDAPHPRVAYLVSPNAMLMSGGNTFIDEMIRAAGGNNAGAQAGDNFLDVGRETLVQLAPDVLLLGAVEEPAEIEDDPRLSTWRTLPIPAARNKRIYLVTDGNSQMASVAIGKNVKALAEMIHAKDGIAASGTGAASGGAKP